MPGPITQAQLAAAPQRLRQAAQAFEAQALSQLLAPAFATVDMSRSAFGGGAAESQWRPMLLDAMAGAAARSGPPGAQGVGIADMVLREMLRLQSAAENPTPSENPT
jgi:peptidoglycan hydrolase FlgJ